MRRRSFLIGLGGAAALWPLAARGQQAVMPVIGFLGAPSAAPYARYVDAIHQGLKQAGFVEGQNVRTEYRWAEGHYDRLPALAADLVSRHVSVIVPIGGTPAVAAAKTATSTTPIVFNIGSDPVKLRLVDSLNRPGGNLTGVAMLALELEAKRLELLRHVVPKSAPIAVLVNPTNAQAEMQAREVQEAAGAVGQEILLLRASTERELETAFAALLRAQAGALLVSADAFFTSQPVLFVVLTARHAIPAIYPWRSHVDAGGLMSYGTSLVDAYRQTGVYTGRVLKGEKPADLPISQAIQFEFVINLVTARALRLTIPLTLRAFATEVIE